jgi:streptogramin lyase
MTPERFPLTEYAFQAVARRLGYVVGQKPCKRTPPALGSERYVGLGVHRAARICSAGHGGQVLVSKTTHDLLQDEESSEAAFKDLGEQRLKDLDRPERIFQLLVPGLPSDFPPLRTMEAQPAEALPFAGKEVELAKAAQASVEGASRRRWRRLLAAALIGVVVAAAVTSVFVFGGSGSDGTGSRPADASARLNSVAVIDPQTGAMVADVPVGESPGPIAVSSGAVWVGNQGDETVSRIDPAKRQVVKTIGLGSSITALAAGEGSLWVASACEGVVQRIDPSTNEVANNTIRFGPRRAEDESLCDDAEFAMVFGEGSLWLGDRDYPSLLRIDPDSGRVVTSISNVDPKALAFGDGTIWVISAADTDVIRVDASTASILTRVPVPDSPHGIVVGDEAIWVAHDRVTGNGAETVSEIDPLTATVTHTIDRGGSLSGGCCYITAMTAKDGVVWVANPLDHTVSRINEVTQEKKIISVGFIPFGLAASGDVIWATLGPFQP